MDENYLDNLLNEFSLDKEIDHKIEDELDADIRSEKRRRKKERTVTREEAFNMDLAHDADSGDIASDFNFSEEQIEELDQLDNLADLDIGDMDFSDIDFDDLDITKISEGLDDNFDDFLKDFDGDLEIPDFSFSDSGDSYEEDNDDFEETARMDEQDQNINDSNDVQNLNEEDDFEKTAVLDNEENTIENDDHHAEEKTDDLNVDSFDADSFLDSLLSEDELSDDSNPQSVQSDEKTELLDGDTEIISEDNESGQDSLNDLLETAEGNDDQLNSESSDEMQALNDDDDLFSMLNLDEQSSDDLDESASGDIPNDNSPVENITELDDSPLDNEVSTTEKPKKKKKTFMEILFGEPDEDDIETEEEIQARQAKKEEKKAKKEAAKAAKAEKAEQAKAKKSLDDAKKKKDEAEKKRIKAEKKAKKKALDEANAEPEKKLNKPMVIFVFSVILGGVGFLYLSTVDFNYKLAIKQAADYFSSQKYHKAYDEIKGVEVKEKDKELKDRIYTVMYVERLYESYENNIELGRQKKALDSLLRGVTKYYEYYDEAQELDIVSDIEYSFSQIRDALENNYGISVERAIEINELDDYEYMKTIEQYTEGMTEE